MRRARLLLILSATVLLTASALLARRCRAPLDADWVYGVDVSHHQGDIDWEALAADGVDFAWIKSTEGGDWTDSRFEENWREAQAAGVDRGACHFFTFCRPGAEQAAHFLSTVPLSEGELPPAVDVEYGGNCSRRPSTAELDAELTTFMDAVEAAHERPLVYLTEEVYLDHASLFEGERLWVRAIYAEPTAPAVVWQYSNVGIKRGVSGRIDLNAYEEGALTRSRP